MENKDLASLAKKIASVQKQIQSCKMTGKFTAGPLNGKTFFSETDLIDAIIPACDTAGIGLAQSVLNVQVNETIPLAIVTTELKIIDLATGAFIVGQSVGGASDETRDKGVRITMDSVKKAITASMNYGLQKMFMFVDSGNGQPIAEEPEQRIQQRAQPAATTQAKAKTAKVYSVAEIKQMLDEKRNQKGPETITRERTKVVGQILTMAAKGDKDGRVALMEFFGINKSKDTLESSGMFLCGWAKPVMDGDEVKEIRAEAYTEAGMIIDYVKASLLNEDEDI